jgi:hypothetical protein
VHAVIHFHISEMVTSISNNVSSALAGGTTGSNKPSKEKSSTFGKKLFSREQSGSSQILKSTKPSSPRPELEATMYDVNSTT